MNRLNERFLQKREKNSTNSIKWYLDKGETASFKKIMEIVWPISIGEMLQLTKNNKIFTSEIHKQLAETFGYIASTVREDSKKTQQLVGRVFDKIKDTNPKEKNNLIKLARLLYSAKLYNVINKSKQLHR